MKNFKTLTASLFLLITLSSCQEHFDYEQEIANNQAASTKYMQAKEAEGYIKRSSGLLYKINTQGTEPKIVVGDTVMTHYTLILPNGAQVESTLGGQPYTFINSDSQLIKGFVEGMTLFGKGGKGVFIIPPSLGYGNNNVNGIGPAQALTFAVEIVDVKIKK